MAVFLNIVFVIAVFFLAIVAYGMLISAITFLFTCIKLRPALLNISRFGKNFLLDVSYLIVPTFMLIAPIPFLGNIFIYIGFISGVFMGIIQTKDAIIANSCFELFFKRYRKKYTRKINRAIELGFDVMEYTYDSMLTNATILNNIAFYVVIFTVLAKIFIK